MWDYDKLFAEGNVIGLKNVGKGIVYTLVVNSPLNWKKNNASNWWDYQNESLKWGAFAIQYIVRLDEHGNVIEKLFDRQRDMKEPMPELKTGMFVKVCDEDDECIYGGIIAEGRVVYQNGGWDCIDGINGVKNDIVAIWDIPYGFSVMDDDEYSPIWEKNA